MIMIMSMIKELLIIEMYQHHNIQKLSLFDIFWKASYWKKEKIGF